MDPFTIATSVAKVTSTCVTTGKAIYDLISKYQDAPRNLVAISSEVTVIGASMAQIQTIVLSKPHLEQLLRSRPEIASILDTSLTGCMVVFSCLNEEVQEVSRHVRGKYGLSWRGRMRTIWKQDTLQELLDSIRGQQLAINTLIQLLSMDSLFEIKELLQQKGPELKQTVERTESLRRSYPSVRIAESIYNRDDRASICSAADSVLASSELEFDFDDIIVNSAAYRRAMAAARHKVVVPESETLNRGRFVRNVLSEEDLKNLLEKARNNNEPVEVPEGDLISFDDNDTLRQAPVTEKAEDVLAISEDLVGLRFSMSVRTIQRHEEGTRHVDQLRVKPNSTGQMNEFSSSTPTTPKLQEPDGDQVEDQATPTESLNMVSSAQQVTVKRKPIPSIHVDTSSGASIGSHSPAGSVSSDQVGISTTNDTTSARSNSTGSRQALEPASSPSLSPPTKVAPRRSSSPPRRCSKCGETLTGQFARALGGTYHVECFTCHDCGKIVASKFFPVPDDPPHEYALCETDYFKKLDLLCFRCGQALRSSYITALDRKFHIEHFTCSVCPHLFGAQDSYYESEGEVYCFHHYASSRAAVCDGCRLPILKQYVEIDRDGRNQLWHSECYMIYKYWNVKMFEIVQIKKKDDYWIDKQGNQVNADMLRQFTDSTEATIHRTWTVLSSFEERAATLISDVLLNVSNGDRSGTQKMCMFVSAIGILFDAIDAVRERRLRNDLRDISYIKEAKLLCEKSVATRQLIERQHDMQVPREKQIRRMGVTDELLSAVTGLAHYLKLLIRIGLQGSLDSLESLGRFLLDFYDKDLNKYLKFYRTKMSSMVFPPSNSCALCKKPVEDDCFREDRLFWRSHLWHTNCLACPNCRQTGAFSGDLSANSKNSYPRTFCRFCRKDRGMEISYVTLLKQYAYLQWVGLARLMEHIQLNPSDLMEVGIEDRTGETTKRNILDELPDVEQGIAKTSRVTSGRVSQAL